MEVLKLMNSNPNWRDLPRAEYANAIKDFTFKHYLFGVYDGKWGVGSYLSSLRPNQVVKMIEALEH